MARSTRRLATLADDGHLTEEHSQYCAAGHTEVVCWACEESICTSCFWRDGAQFKRQHATCKVVDLYDHADDERRHDYD